MSLISRDQLDAMGKDLIHLCDQLEPHGLVDYQLGIWEEEILSGMYTLFSNIIEPITGSFSCSFLYFSLFIERYSHLTYTALTQCLDVIENRPDLLHIQTLPEPTAAAPRP